MEHASDRAFGTCNQFAGDRIEERQNVQSANLDCGGTL